MNARSLLLTAATVLGLVAVFLAERVVGAGPVRPLLDVLGVLAVAAAAVVRWNRSALSAAAPRARVERVFAVLSTLAVLAVVAWFAQSEVVLAAGGPDVHERPPGGDGAPDPHRAPGRVGRASAPPRRAGVRRDVPRARGRGGAGAGRGGDRRGAGLGAHRRARPRLGGRRPRRLPGLELLPPGSRERLDPRAGPRPDRAGDPDPLLSAGLRGGRGGARLRHVAGDGEPAAPRRAPGRGGGPCPGPGARGERERRHRGEPRRAARDLPHRHQPGHVEEPAPRAGPRGADAASTRWPGRPGSSTSPPVTASAPR